MVAIYTPPDNTSQNGAAYKTNLDGAAVAAARAALAFLPQPQAVADMTVKLLAGAIFVSGTLTEIAAQSTPTFTAPAVNPRIDRIVLNPSTGALLVVTGSEAVSPVAPAIPAGYIPIARVALATSTTAIGASLITDERVVSSGSTSSSSISSTQSFDESDAARLTLAYLGQNIPLNTLVN